MRVHVRLFSSFGIHPLSRHDIRTEERYRLVQRDSNPNAQSDTMITIPYLVLGDHFLDEQPSFADTSLIDELFWSANGSRDTFSIIGFLAEHKRDDAATNMNQLIMVLTTAQSQRRALGLKNSVIMGATACRGNVLIFSSFWGDPDESVGSHITSAATTTQFFPVRLDLSTPTKI
jgi:hypothetical protein